MALAADAVKKPQSPYFLWFSAKREDIQREIGSKDFGECGRKGSELWKTMTPSDKQPFEDEYKRQKEAFEKFKATPEGQKALEEKKAEKSDKKDAKDKRAAKSAVKAVDKDDKLKKPLSAYFAWLNDNRERLTAELDGKGGSEVTKKGSAEWKALSDEARKPWEDRNKQEVDAYNEYLKSEDGAAALKAYKEATDAVKWRPKGEAKDKVVSEEKADGSSPSKKRQAPKEGVARPVRQSPKKEAKVAGGGTRSSPKAKAVPEAQFSEEVLVACQAAQKGNSDVAYESLLRKLLQTEQLKDKGLTPMNGLKALEASGGLLNKARGNLLAELGA